jgi:hypothetical protein
MPLAVPVTPRYNSRPANNDANTDAGIGIGGISGITLRFGNIIAKPSSKPYNATRRTDGRCAVA